MTSFKTLYKRILTYTKRRRRTARVHDLPSSASLKYIGALNETSKFEIFDKMYNAPRSTHRPNLTFYEMWFRNLKHYDEMASSEDVSSIASTSSTLCQFTPNNSPVIKSFRGANCGSMSSGIFNNSSTLDTPTPTHTKPSMREVVVEDEIIAIELTRRR